MGTSRSLYLLSLVKFYPLDLSLHCMWSDMFIKPFFNYRGLYRNTIYSVQNLEIKTFAVVYLCAPNSLLTASQVLILGDAGDFFIPAFNNRLLSQGTKTRRKSPQIGLLHHVPIFHMFFTYFLVQHIPNDKIRHDYVLHWAQEPFTL